MPPNRLQQQTSFWRIGSTLKFKRNHFVCWARGRWEVMKARGKERGLGLRTSVLIEGINIS